MNETERAVRLLFLYGQRCFQFALVVCCERVVMDIAPHFLKGNPDNTSESQTDRVRSHDAIHRGHP